MAGALTVVDFRLFPDNHVMPPQFSLGSLDFAAINPAAPLFVNDTAGDRGLQFEETGLRVGLPGVVNGLLLTAGGFNGPITICAKDVAGTVILNQQLLPANKFIRQLLNAPGMTQLELVEGGHEGILLEIVVPI